MSQHLIVLTGAIYAYVCAEQLFKGEYGLACMYAGYSFASFGSWLLIVRT